MQVSVESIGKLERRMQVQVPAERVAKEIASRLKTLSRTARLNGFRPGKAPLNVIRRQFGVQVHREVIGELLQSSFAEAVSANQLAPAGNPRIEPQSVDEGQDLRYVATFEVFPDVVLQPIEALEVVRVTAEVAPGDVDAMLERLRKQQIKFTAVSRAAAAGDRVLIDFDGSIGGATFAGGKGQNIAIVLGEGRMLPDFEQGLIGVSGGEDKEVGVNFPADYRAAELAGKAATFKIHVNGVEESRLPDLDEEFCKAFGVNEGGLERLRVEVADNMRRELDQTLRNQNKSVVMDRLLLANPIDVPNTLIEAQVRDLQADAMRRSGAKDASQAPPAQALIEPARRRAALGLILADIIKRQNLRVDPARANARLDEMVGAYGDAEAVKRAYLQNPDAMRQVENLALEDQVVDWVLGHAKVHAVSSTFKELMKFEA
ncbi:MAG TPA: trigger factor [Steroidobacteraceae bacterium]|nr:trigger factor [Steroidobacteraceae bacterium]